MNKINTETDLYNNFAKIDDHPIWYYKELEEVPLNWVMYNLLKENFVVEIDGCKHGLTFGLNKDNEISRCCRHDDIKHSNLISSDVMERGLREGKWFIVTNKDTTEEFKREYNEIKEKYKQAEIEQWYRDILIRALARGIKNKTITIEDEMINYLLDCSFEELQECMDRLMGVNRDE